MRFLDPGPSDALSRPPGWRDSGHVNALGCDAGLSAERGYRSSSAGSLSTCQIASPRTSNAAAIPSAARATMRVMLAVWGVLPRTIVGTASVVAALLHRPASTARRFQQATTSSRLATATAPFAAMSNTDTERDGRALCAYQRAQGTDRRDRLA